MAYYLVSYDVTAESATAYDSVHSKLMKELDKLGAEQKLHSQYLVTTTIGKNDLFDRILNALNPDESLIRLLVTVIRPHSCICTKLLGRTNLNNI